MEYLELVACLLCVFTLCYVSVLYIKLGIKLQDQARFMKYVVFPLWLIFADETGQGMLALSGALKGQTDAEARLGLHYLSGSMPGTYKRFWYRFNLWWPQNAERGNYWLSKATASGSPEAETILANAYLEGDMGLPQNTAKAIEYLKKIVENSKATEDAKDAAAYNLFLVYGDKESQYYDPANALRYCVIAAGDNGEASFKLAKAYEGGEFGETDLGKAFIYYKRAVEHGYPDALGDYTRLAEELGQK